MATAFAPSIYFGTRLRLVSGRRCRARGRLVCAVSAGSAKVEPWLPTVDAYERVYATSLRDPDTFWSSIADSFHWHAPSAASPDESFVPPGVKVSWFDKAQTNIAYNALDRWVEKGHGARPAFFCEGNEYGLERVVSYEQLLDTVKRLANVLLARGVKKGDVVVLYMPMVPELPATMLACARIGAIHSVVFAGFSAEALAGRIVDSRARIVVTVEHVRRAKKVIPLKSIADEAIDIARDRHGHVVETQIVAPATSPANEPASYTAGRDIKWTDELAKASDRCAVEWVSGEHPLFILYTSGSTGTPKGVVHSTAGYMLYTATTFKYAFDYHEGDVFFSTSDCGWITGHSYVTYGPLLNGATQVLHEGVPNFPDAGRLWEIVQKYGVAQLYTAPTVIRALKGAAPPAPTQNNRAPSADDWVKQHDRSSLRVLGTVGEPINAEAWEWYHDVVGEGRCSIVDTWWQTETGGHCILSLPIPNSPKKPGCAMMPFFGIEPAILREDGIEVNGEGSGLLVIKRSWPSTLRTVFGDHKRMEETYFSRFPGYYFTGDGARRDKDGHYWLTGRVDDIVNISGHRIGTAEIEGAITLHEAVAEAAVVGVPHNIKGEALYAYVSLMSGISPNETLRREICGTVRKEIGPIATPDTIHWAPALPKTRSGKIMRRILRKIAVNGSGTQVGNLGDTSTLTDPTVVYQLLETYGK